MTDGLARAKRSLEMVKWLVNNNARQKDSFKNSSLVHFPIFSCRFHYDFVQIIIANKLLSLLGGSFLIDSKLFLRYSFSVIKVAVHD